MGKPLEWTKGQVSNEIPPDGWAPRSSESAHTGRTEAPLLVAGVQGGGLRGGGEEGDAPQQILDARIVLGEAMLR